MSLSHKTFKTLSSNHQLFILDHTLCIMVCWSVGRLVARPAALNHGLKKAEARLSGLMRAYCVFIERGLSRLDVSVDTLSRNPLRSARTRPQRHDGASKPFRKGIADSCRLRYVNWITEEASTRASLIQSYITLAFTHRAAAPRWNAVIASLRYFVSGS